MTDPRQGNAHDWHLPRIPWEYWIDRPSWTSYLAFLMITGATVLLSLPYSQQIRELTAGIFGAVGLFTVVFVIIYGIVAVSLGQLEERCDWIAQSDWRGHLTHLLARQFLALALTLPYWVVFLAAYGLPLERLAGILGHLLLYGSVLGLLGWRLAHSGRSEIVEFNLKYLGLMAFWAGSLFIPGLRELNPFQPITYWLEGSPFIHGSELLLRALAWLGLAVLVAFWVRRALRAPSESNRRRDGV
jgi:uncharacterized membrane protein